MPETPTHTEPLETPTPRYMQLARRVADEIKAGKYAPGDLLPSEAEMSKRYGVGKHTVRAAIAELRGMGLIDVRQGKGSIVRGEPGPAHEINRAISRSGKKWKLHEGMSEAGEPCVTRTTFDGLPAHLMDMQDQDAFSVDRQLYAPETGARAAHRMLIPLSTAALAPDLGTEPDAPVEVIYGRLSDAGESLSWTDHVTARLPYPDERAALSLPDGSPLMLAYRVTHGTDERPLLCEELRAPAVAHRLVFPVWPTRASRPRQSV
ncbi:GntR family transcriptional regulator [Streptomyces sp. NPDC048172]|uniref:GntR family transcriptional regulator n=1 Tax=Streptomyces sp. NPDC048172 TaxID=3365505 RepID=UPI003723681B